MPPQVLAAAVLVCAVLTVLLTCVLGGVVARVGEEMGVCDTAQVRRAGTRVVDESGLPKVGDGPSLHEAVLEVAAAAGAVGECVLAATRSASVGGGKITPVEAGVVARACREVVREADEVACSMEMVAKGGGA